MKNLGQNHFEKRDNSEVDISYIFNFYKRKRFIIIILTSFLSLIGGLISLQIKPTYQGNFKIYGLMNPETGLVLWEEVLNKYKLQSNINYIVPKKSSLKRRSILKPVFENYKKKILPKNNTLLTFSEWSKNLDLDIIDNSEIISISFKDKNKKLLIETLKDLKMQYKKLFEKNNEITFRNASNIIKARFLINSLEKETFDNKKLIVKIDKKLEEKNILNNLLETINLIKNQSNFLISFSEIEMDKIIYEPNKINLLLTTSIISFLLISFVLLFSEFFSKKIYDFDILKMKIDAKYLGDLYYKDQINSKILLNKIINQNNIKDSSVGLLIPNSVPDKKIDLSKFLKDLDENLKNKTLTKVNAIINFEEIFIITCEGAYSYKDIELLNNYIFVYGEKIKGWVFIK